MIWQTKDWNTPGRASLWSRHEGLPNLKVVQHLHSIDYSEYRYRLAPAGRRAQTLAVSWTLVRHKEEEAYWWAWNRKPICPKLCTDTKQKLSTAGGGTGNPPILDPAQVCSKVLLETHSCWGPSVGGALLLLPRGKKHETYLCSYITSRAECLTEEERGCWGSPTPKDQV